MNRLENLEDILAKPMRQANLTPERKADLVTLVAVVRAMEQIEMVIGFAATVPPTMVLPRWWQELADIARKALVPLMEDAGDG